MHTLRIFLAALLFLPLACSHSKKAARHKSPQALQSRFILECGSFRNGQAIPREHTCDGADGSPEFRWTEPPKGTQSFVLIMEDPDAAGGPWVHWVLYDLPGELRLLEKNIPKKELLPNGAKQGSSWGTTRFDRIGYFGPCPPAGAEHHYVFHLLALDSKLNFPPKATKQDIEIAVRRKVLAEAVIVGTYQR